jgi:hypothetical protein
MRSLRMPGEPGLRSISQTEQAQSERGVLAFPAMGTLAFRRSTWDFWSGPVLAVGSAFPPGSCSVPHGSSLPGGAGLANLPGAAANRIRRRHDRLRLTRTPSRKRSP